MGCWGQKWSKYYILGQNSCWKAWEKNENQQWRQKKKPVRSEKQTNNETIIKRVEFTKLETQW